MESLIIFISAVVSLNTATYSTGNQTKSKIQGKEKEEVTACISTSNLRGGWDYN
ncbi:MAG: hypothetical protein IPJ79_05750 [Bacteroidetes bacterium]|nr:hypothetical protein [Bacteroidota bacterium]